MQAAGGTQLPPHQRWCCRASVCAAAGYEQCAGKLLRLLERLVYLRDITPDYTYYGIASPWLQTKVLRALQYFPLPEGTGAQKQLHDVLQGIFGGELQQTKVLACLPAPARVPSYAHSWSR